MTQLNNVYKLEFVLYLIFFVSTKVIKDSTYGSMNCRFSENIHFVIAACYELEVLSYSEVG